MKWVFLRRHNDKQVHIAILRRLAIGVGAEEDHLLRVELFDNLPGDSSYPFKDCGRDNRALLAFEIRFRLHIDYSSLSARHSALI